MKPLIFLLVVAIGDADKLDRSYLPPANAASSGGSPGALTAPGGKPNFAVPLGSGVQSGNSFGQGISSAFGSQPGFNAEKLGSSTYGGASGGFQTETGYGTANGQGSGPNVAVSGGGRPFTTHTDASEGQNLSPNFENYNLGGQQSPQTQPSGPSGQTAGRGGQSFNVPEPYKSERAQAAADRNAEILKYVNDNNGDTYTYSYETSNGISAEESGTATGGVKAQGGFAYTDDDGHAYSVTYTADENGFQPQGEHLPTPHPIPEEILKSIEENAKAAAAGTQEGSYRPEEYESDKEEYNAGIPSYGVPQGSQGSKQGSISLQRPDITQAQSNQFAVSQGTVGTSQLNGQAGKFGQSSSSQESAGQTGIQGQNNRYQASFENNKQGTSGQLPGPSSVGQNQFSEGHGQGPDGYKYNQPQNEIAPATQFGVSSGSGNDQGNFALKLGNRPENLFGTAQQFLNKPGSQPGNSIQPFGQGQQNNLNINRPSNYQGLSKESQINLGNQGPGSGTTGSFNQGYQYQTNANRSPFGLDNGSDGNLESTGQSQQTPKQPLLGINIGSNKGSTQVPPGNQNIGSGNQPGQGNQSPISSNRKPSQSSPLGPERPTFGSSPSTQGSSAPSSIQAPYQYDRPGQSFPTQPQRFNGQGPETSSSRFQAVTGRPSGSVGSQGVNGQQFNGNILGYQGSDGQHPSGSAPGSRGANGQQSTGASSSYQRENEQSPGFGAPGAQGFNGQQPGIDDGYQGGNGQRVGSGAPGSQGLIGQQPGGNSPGYQGGKGQSLGVGSPSQSGAAQRPGYSSIGSTAGGATPAGQGGDSGPGQFAGPRQPASFSPQEGYRY